MIGRSMATVHNPYTLVSQNGTCGVGVQRPALWRGLLSIGTLLADIVAIIGVSCTTGFAYHLVVYGNAGDILHYLQLGALAATVFSSMRMLDGAYAAAEITTAPWQPGKTFHFWNLTMVTLLVIGFIVKNVAVYSRGSILLFYVAAFPTLLLVRWSIARASLSLNRARLVFLQRIFLFGDGASIREFTERYEQTLAGATIVGCRFITPLEAGAGTAERLSGLRNDVDAAIASARSLSPDAVVMMMPWSDAETVDFCVDRFMALPTEIHLGPDRVLRRYEDVQLTRLGSFASLRLTRIPLTGLELALKRGLDLVLASLALFILTPVLVATAIAIKLDSDGPVFFLQQRFGFNQRPFRIIKFRTMSTMDDGDVVRQTTRNDSRVTAVGRWLRRLNIDEIPQLFNVIMGDMSLVGPRPHAVSHDREYGRKIADYARRHNVKPGITGWAQVNGFRGETDTDEKMERRVAHDLYYIENWSIALDLRILFLTVFSRKAFSNAY